LLQAADVHVAFGRAEVLHGVSVSIDRGAVVGVLGPNGSGKTTLLRVLSGGLAPTTGTVALDGVPLASLPRRMLARRVAVVPQEIHPVFDYSVLDLALMGRYAHLGAFDFESADDVRAARMALAATGTDDLEARPFDTLSGGEKQRVIIASALAQFDGIADAVVDMRGADMRKADVRDNGRRDDANRGNRTDDAGRADSKVLVLDEPTAALDLHYQVDVGLLLRRLNERAGLTMVVSTHDLQFAAQVCDAVVLLRDGRVLAAGPTETTLTPATVRELYGVDVDELVHPDGRRVLVSVGLPERRR
jgi:iron complex transport system ATP-binding protein